LTEDPWPTIWTGLAVEILLLVAFFQTRRGLVLLGMSTVLLATGGLVLVERSIVTERERVEMVLAGLADALPTDDHAAIMAHLTPAAQSKAARPLAIFKITKANVGNDLEITINELTSPPSARATFTGRLDIESRRGGEYKQPVVRRFTLVFVRDGDRWLLDDYEHR
jgi:ketosteroid isomerase-like protein